MSSKGDSLKKNKKLYHGSYVVVKEPRVIRRTKGRNGDFGDAFYLTEIEEQARKRAAVKAIEESLKEGIVNVYTLNYKKATSLINHKKFKEVNKEYLDFIAQSRSGVSNDFDIIEGELADDKIYRYVDKYLQGKISYELFLEKAKFRK